MKKALRAIGTALLCLLLMAVFYLAVILGEPQNDDSAALPTPRADQPLLSPLPAAVYITDEKQLDQVFSAFPAPVMHVGRGNALTFVQGQCSDVSFEGGLGRVAALTYRTETGLDLTVASIYPARALSLMGKGDYVISGVAGQTLAGLRSVRMENGTHIRLHAQGTEALYTVTVPLTDAAVLRQLAAAAQFN